MPSKTLQSLALEYVTERRRRGHFTGNTPRTVTSVLLRFAQHFGEDFPAGRLTRGHLERWANAQHVGPSTLRNHISVVRAFCAWMAANDHLKADPSRTLRGPRAPRMLPRGLKADLVGQLFEVLPDARAELIVSLMVQEGLRCAEVAGLTVERVDLAEGAVLVVGKGGHERVVSLTDETRSALTRYLSEHPARTGPLIRSYVSAYRPLTPGRVSELLRLWMLEADVKQVPYDGVSAHSLRHTAATDMLKAGAHVRDVQTILGHASLATTQLYLPWLVGDVRDAMAGRTYKRQSSPATATGDSAA